PGAAVGGAPLFEALLADTDHGVLLLDPDRRIARINAAAAAMLGTTVSRARGNPAAPLLATVVTGDDPVREGYRHRVGESEAMLMTQRGGELPVTIRTFRLGTPPWLLVTLRDQTGERRMQEGLRRNQRPALLGQLATG